MSFMTYLQYLNHFHAIFVKWDKTRKHHILNFQPLLVTKTDFLITISIQYLKQTSDRNEEKHQLEDD